MGPRQLCVFGGGEIQLNLYWCSCFIPVETAIDLLSYIYIAPKDILLVHDDVKTPAISLNAYLFSVGEEYKI